VTVPRLGPGVDAQLDAGDDLTDIEARRPPPDGPGPLAGPLPPLADLSPLDQLRAEAAHEQGLPTPGGVPAPEPPAKDPRPGAASAGPEHAPEDRHYRELRRGTWFRLILGGLAFAGGLSLIGFVAAMNVLEFHHLAVSLTIIGLESKVVEIYIVKAVGSAAAMLAGYWILRLGSGLTRPLLMDDKRSDEAAPLPPNLVDVNALIKALIDAIADWLKKRR
jgi:hypothetical protein